jgi:hypothetical protein
MIARAARQALLWAGPLGIGLALLTLLAAAPFFRQGPETPSAGDPRAWTALWGALALTGIGCAVGAVANAVWLIVTLRSGQRPRGPEWFRTALNLLMGIACVLYWSR